jgi:hypothetical protein
MSSLVKLFHSAAGFPKYGEYTFEHQWEVKPTRDLMGAEFYYKGDELLAKGKPTSITIGRVIPTTYHIILDVPLTLQRQCKHLIYSRVGIPGEPLDLVLDLIPNTDIALSEFPYVMRMFMLD